MANVPKKEARSQKRLLSLAGGERVIKLLADKWTVPVLNMLRAGTMRHAELRRGLLAVSQRMLTKTLRSLERDGLLRRHVHAQVPPKVEYSLTALGRSLSESLVAVCRWIERHGPELDRVAHRGAARRAVDPAHGDGDA